MKKRKYKIYSFILVAIFIISVTFRGFISRNVLNINDLNESFKLAIFFELGLIILGLICAKVIFGWNNVGFKRVNWNNLKWCSGYFIVIIVFWIYLCFTIVKNVSSLNMPLVLITIAMSITVGIAEELFYRGFVFHSFQNKVAAVLVSSALFGLMHLSNIPSSGIMGAMMQVVMTFIVGIAFSITLLKVKNIIPLIIMHATFDLISFMDGLFLNNTYSPDIFRITFIITLLVTAISVVISFIINKNK